MTAAVFLAMRFIFPASAGAGMRGAFVAASLIMWWVVPTIGRFRNPEQRIERPVDAFGAASIIA